MEAEKAALLQTKERNEEELERIKEAVSQLH